MNIEIINEKHKEIKNSFAEVFQGRSNFQIDNFVVGQHLSEERRYAQCVVELQSKYYNLRRYDIQRRRLLKEIETSEGFDREEKELDLEQLDIGIVGQIREFDHLYRIYKSMPKFTYEELEVGEQKYWLERLSTQAQIDIEAHGTVSTGNAEALRQINLIKGHYDRFMENVLHHPGVTKYFNK
jgi:hypothetical protein